MDLLSLVERDVYTPDNVSRWYCDRPDCDGTPHGEHWHWCAHPLDGPHTKECRHARASQRPPDGSWFYWLLLSGRGFGKSRAAAEWLVEQAWNSPPAEWAVIARSSVDARKCARDMDAGLVKVAGRRLRQYNRHEEDVYLENGAVIHLISADKPDRLRGFNLAGAWCDELASWRYPETWHEGLLPTLRSGSRPRVVITTTPKPTALLRELVEKARADLEKPIGERSWALTTGSTYDNAANLADQFVEQMQAAYSGTRVGRQELYGELLLDEAGALVSYAMIEDARMEPSDLRDVNLSRIVVAVDPATSYGEGSDETGIIVCGRDREGHGYVLADYSCRESPEGWAKQAVKAFERYEADRIVAEKNQGGSMVEHVIRSVAPHIPYTPVMARVSKRLRAEPITALYEQGRIHHAGTFEVLEDQLITWSPESKKSPDRMDALVHGFTELGLARWGQGAAFVEMWKRQIENPRDGLTPSQRAIKRDQERRSRSGLLRRRTRACKHLFRAGPAGTLCVHCNEPPLAS